MRYNRAVKSPAVKSCSLKTKRRRKKREEGGTIRRIKNTPPPRPAASRSNCSCIAASEWDERARRRVYICKPRQGAVVRPDARFTRSFRLSGVTDRYRVFRSGTLKLILSFSPLLFFVVSLAISFITCGDADDILAEEVRGLRFLDSHDALVLLTTAATAVGCNCSFLLFRARSRNVRGILLLLPRAL